MVSVLHAYEINLVLTNIFKGNIQEGITTNEFVCIGKFHDPDFNLIDEFEEYTFHALNKGLYWLFAVEPII